MELKKIHWISIIFAGLILIAGGIFFFNNDDMNLLFFLIGISLAVVGLPFIYSLTIESKQEEEINSMFLEFSRNLAESVTTGTPISKSIVNMKKRNYGVLSRHIVKLANQIELGIPVGKALENFSSDIGSNVIDRAVGLIREAERAGGEIDYILDSVAKSISEIDKLKKERQAAVYNLVVEGYIIFFIFIGIMLVMQFKILPLVADIGSVSALTSGDIGGLQSGLSNQVEEDPEEQVDLVESIGRSFLYLLIAQGLFTGLVIGKISEGKVKRGIKHSAILVIAAFLTSSGANLFLG